MVDGVIVLYDQNETSFTSNGLGYLPDATECTVIEELNGEFELEMEYPITGTRYDQIQHRRILYVKTNPYEDPQPFRIYNINKPIDGLVEVNARHISYDLSGYALPWISNGKGEKSDLPFATGPASAVENLPALVNQLNTGMQPFTYWTNSTEDYPRDPDDETQNQLKEPHWIFIDTPTTARNLLGIFTEKYKGEFKFDKFNVKFYGPVSGQSEDDTHYRGKDSGVVLRYGKNLTDLMQEEDSDKGMYTHIYPFWSGTIDVQKEGSEQSTTETKETVIELSDKLYPINSNVDPGYKRIYVYDVTSDYTDELKSKDKLNHPSEETLKEMCDKLIKENKLGTPNITLTASFVQLSKSVEYSNLALLEKILLGDTVTVDFPKLDVKSTLKCTAIEYNVLTDEYKTITLGDERNTSSGVSSTIASTASISASNSTAIAGSATKQDVFGKSYDTALSITSENAVQNKVVTGAFNSTNGRVKSLEDCCKNVNREIAEIIEKIEDGGSSITYGYTNPSGGSDGDAYVKIKDRRISDSPTLSPSNIHGNFEIKNFSDGLNGSCTFKIVGTVGEGDTNYAVLNVENLMIGRTYMVKAKISHNGSSSTMTTNRTKGFGINYLARKDRHMTLNFRYRGLTSSYDQYYLCDGYSGYCPASIPVWYAHGNFGPSGEPLSFREIAQSGAAREYDFYFDATSETAGLDFIFDDFVNANGCNMNVELTVYYIGVSATPSQTFYSGNFGSEWQNVVNQIWYSRGRGYDAYYEGTEYSGTPSKFLKPMVMETSHKYGEPTGLDFKTTHKLDRMTFYTFGTNFYNLDESGYATIKIQGIKADGSYVDIINSYKIAWKCGVYNWYDIELDGGEYLKFRVVNISTESEWTSLYIGGIRVYAETDVRIETEIDKLFFKIDDKWLEYPSVEVTQIQDEGVNIANIKIGNDTTKLYAPNGGGGSGSFSYDLLYENTNLTPSSGTSQVNRTHTLSTSIDDYNAILVYAYMYNKLSNNIKEQIETMLIFKPEYYDGSFTDGNWRFLFNGIVAGTDRRLVFNIANSTTINTTATRAEDGMEPILWKIYGIK